MTDRNERRPGSADKTVREIRRATRPKKRHVGQTSLVSTGISIRRDGSVS